MEQLEDRIQALKEKQDLLKERIDLLVYAEKKQNHEIERTFYEERYLVLSQEKDTLGKDLYCTLNLSACTNNLKKSSIPIIKMFSERFYCRTKTNLGIKFSIV